MCVGGLHVYSYSLTRGRCYRCRNTGEKTQVKCPLCFCLDRSENISTQADNIKVSSKEETTSVQWDEDTGGKLYTTDTED